MSITTHCNMQCPDCLYGMRFRTPEHSPHEVVIADSRFFTGMEDVTLTGGEPTVHPQFDLIVLNVKKLIAPTKLKMETNGVSYPRWKNLYAEFDEISVTHYIPSTWIGCPDNTRQVTAILANHPNAKAPESKHVRNIPSTCNRPCSRTGRLHYSQRKLYGCCIGPGMAGSVGIEIGPDWRQRISEMTVACSECPLAEC